jgi:hypothetical protein
VQYRGKNLRKKKIKGKLLSIKPKYQFSRNKLVEKSQKHMDDLQKHIVHGWH